MVSGCSVTMDPSASIFALLSRWVWTVSCRKIAEELVAGAGLPFSQTSPSLCTMARLASCAIDDAGRMATGKTTISAPQTSLRHTDKKTPASSAQPASRKLSLRDSGRLLPCVVTCGGVGYEAVTRRLHDQDGSCGNL